MEPSGASTSALTALTCGSSSMTVLTARESLSWPRLVATTFSSVPPLKSAWLVCIQLLVPTPHAGAASKPMVNRNTGFIRPLVWETISTPRRQEKKGSPRSRRERKEETNQTIQLKEEIFFPILLRALC